MNPTILAGATVALVALAIVAARALRRDLGTLVAILLFGLGGGLTAFAMATRAPAVPEAAVAERPVEVQTEGYVTSTACRACHPREYATWRSSYHSTMTRRPEPGVVVGDFDGVELSRFGRRWNLSRDGDDYWIDMDDPMAPAGQGARVRRKVTLTTGSHHMQLCWYETGFSRVMGLLPFVYLRQERRWIPRQSAFVQPPSQDVLHEMGQWTLVCLKCHATNGRPRADYDNTGLHSADTHVSEFGIACEACHGTAAAHVQANHNPARRYLQHASDAGDPTIVNPARLDHVRSAQVCGQCHGIFDLTLKGQALAEFLANGFAYRPGDDLLQTRPLHAEKGRDEQFWADGEPRVAGREFTGLAKTGCYTRGEMSCVTCHVLHQASDDPRPAAEWADDQLRTRDVDPTCMRCHEKIAADVPAHTHHAAGSSGSRCDNCHMPFSTYGLLKGVRNHHVVAPAVTATLATGRPNACNLCHLDQTLAWTADALHRWYGTDVPDLTSDDKSYAASVNTVLKGDAAQRVLLAFGLGWDAARAVSGQDWIPLYLAELLDDPYEAVRLVAARSLRRLPGYGDFAAELLSPDASARAKAEVLARWQPTMAGTGGTARDQLLLAPDGSVRRDVYQALLNRRSVLKITLFE